MDKFKLEMLSAGGEKFKRCFPKNNKKAYKQKIRRFCRRNIKQEDKNSLNETE